MEGSERHERQNPVGHCNPGNGLSFYWMFKHGTVLAEPCWVLRTNRTPGGDEKVGAMLMGVAFVIGVFWALRLSRQSAKAAPVRSTLSANVTRPQFREQPAIGLGSSYNSRDMLSMRTARANDSDAIWAILEPVIRAGETYTLPRDMNREALAFWFATGHEVFVAEDEGIVVGTYFLRANQAGGGSHVANCGYITAAGESGKGVGRAMCAHSLEYAKGRGFRAMQFNFVVSTNERAVRLWKSFGFEIVGCLPQAFLHPVKGYTDAYIMYRAL